MTALMMDASRFNIWRTAITRLFEYSDTPRYGEEFYGFTEPYGNLVYPVASVIGTYLAGWLHDAFSDADFSAERLDEITLELEQGNFTKGQIKMIVNLLAEFSSDDFSNIDPMAQSMAAQLNAMGPHEFLCHLLAQAEGHLGSETSEEIVGDRHDNWIFGRSGDDVLHGGRGNDHLDGSNDDDALFGGKGDDSLFGGVGSDRLYGRAGNDYLSGGEGGDVIAGGRGNDIMRGKDGRDLFVFRADGGSDVIDDFTIGEDKMKFAKADQLSDLSFDRMGSDVMVSFRQVEVLVEDVTVADLRDADNFLF